MTKVLICMAMSALVLSAQGQTASVSGAVTAEGLSSMATTVVRYQRMPVYLSGRNLGQKPQMAPGESVVRGVTPVGEDGTYKLPVLTPGEYMLCADPPDVSHVDSCEWSGPTRAVVGAGAQYVVPTIILASGRQVSIVVFDPQGLVRKDSVGSNGGLIVGIMESSGRFHRATLSTVANSYLTYTITVPPGSYGVWVSSTVLSIESASGTLLKSHGQQFPITVAIGGADPHPMSFSVTGIQNR